jgi:hypothetical protein
VLRNACAMSMQSAPNGPSILCPGTGRAIPTIVPINSSEAVTAEALPTVPMRLSIRLPQRDDETSRLITASHPFQTLGRSASARTFA